MQTTSESTPKNTQPTGKGEKKSGKKAVTDGLGAMSGPYIPEKAPTRPKTGGLGTFRARKAREQGQDGEKAVAGAK